MKKFSFGCLMHFKNIIKQPNLDLSFILVSLTGYVITLCINHLGQFLDLIF